MHKMLFLVVILAFTLSAPANNKLGQVPVFNFLRRGYPNDYNTSIYSDYLYVKNTSSAFHYVFVESANGAGNKDPVISWLNGGL